MEGSIMVDCKRIGRGRRKGWGESWSLHSYRGHELEGKEIWKRLKQSLGCIAHSRTLPWLGLFLLRRPKCSWRSEFPTRRGSKPKALPFAVPSQCRKARLTRSKKVWEKLIPTDREFLMYWNRIDRCSETNSMDERRGD